MTRRHTPLFTMIAAALSISVIASGCVMTHAPTKTLMNVNEMPTHVHGSWIYVTLKRTPEENRTFHLGGELIAITKDTLYVAAPIFHALPLAAVKEAQLAAFDSYAESVFGLAILGHMSTITNGIYGIVFTAPMWLIGGAIVAVDRSYTPIFTYPDDPVEQVSLYARFPAGLPENIDRNTLVMIQDTRKPFGF